jgi:uncharacterized RDD family membrane protein YckC
VIWAPAPWGSRLVAGVLDWSVALVVPFLVAGALATPLWPVAVATVVLAWFAIGLRRGRTPGMRALRLHVFGPGGREPRAGRAVARALLSVAQGFVGIAVFVVAFADVAAPAGVGVTVLALAALGVWAHVPLGEGGRTPLDRLFGLSVVRPERAPAAPPA